MAGDTESVMRKIMTYNDANDFGFVSGGDVAKLADITSELLATSYFKSQFLTVWIDNLYFKKAIRVKDEVTVKASINCVRKTSMEIGIRIEVTSNDSKKTEHVTSLYAVLVAVDNDINPRPIPPLKVRTGVQKRRHEEGLKRMDERLKIKENIDKKKGKI
jgi:acyl-CoA hydrolase